LSWVRQEINGSRLQGTSVVTSNSDGATGNSMEPTQAVDCVDNGVQSSKFTLVRVTLLHRARDSVVAKHMVVGGCTFDDKCRGAQSATQGAITHHHSCALGNGLGHCEPIVVGLDMLCCPKASGGGGRGWLPGGWTEPHQVAEGWRRQCPAFWQRIRTLAPLHRNDCQGGASTEGPAWEK